MSRAEARTPSKRKAGINPPAGRGAAAEGLSLGPGGALRAFQRGPARPIDPWHEDAHLSCEHDGTLWITAFPGPYDDFPPLKLGNAHDGVDWPEQLGEEPKWWITESAYMIDLWEDSRK